MQKLVPLLLAASLGGCISFGGKPPAQLLTISAAAQLPPGTTQSSASSATMTVLVPTVPHELATTRIPVHASGVAIAYVKDATWSEAPPRLFARVLGDTIAARTGRVILSYRQSLHDPGAMLSGELRMFGVDATTSEAVVTYDAVLSRGGDDPVFEKRRFEARAPVTPIEAQPVAAALEAAANRVAEQVADWVGK